MTDKLLAQELLDEIPDSPPENTGEPPADTKAMIQEIIEYEERFLTLYDYIMMYRTQQRQKYEQMSYDKLVNIYNEFFGGIY